jgi:hypothetical protein
MIVHEESDGLLNYGPLNSYDIKNIKLEFNGQTMIDPAVADSIYLTAVEPMNKHKRVPDKIIYNYSFAIDPENYQPTGQINMSRIINKLLTVNFSSSGTDRKLRIYAKSYNILRIKDGVAGILFIDNNFI